MPETTAAAVATVTPEPTVAAITAVMPEPTVTAASTVWGRPDSHRSTRQVGPAGRVLVIGLVCFGVWSFVAAPTLLRSAEASPLGARRTAALAVLRPIARLTAFLGIDRLGNGIDRLIGRSRESALRTPPAIPVRPPLLEPFAVAPPHPHKRPSRLKIAVTPALLAQYRDAGEKFLKARNPFALPEPSKHHTITVMTVGDSVGADLGNGLARLVGGRTGFNVHLDARVSTGLARQDYFNWPYHIAADVRSYRPDVVVALFGVNDPMNGFFIGSHGIPYGTQEWSLGYRSRVAKIMKLITKSGRPLIWVGLPIVSDPKRESGVRTINAIFREEARKHPGVVYVDAWKLFAGPHGRYSAYLPTPSGGEQLVRMPDGVHLTPTGGDRLAKDVYQAMSRFWQRPG